MRTFIEEVACHLVQKHNENISNLKVIFPGKRAGHFFNDALKELISRPIWQPEYLSINDLMFEITGLKPADNIRLITELYQVYSKYHTESIDSFYFWGDVLLSNFDMVDKYLIDEKLLFKNISELKELDGDYSFLSENQQAIIKQFWKNFNFEGKNSTEKQQFLTIWNTLLAIYNDYSQRLKELGLAYTGMIYKQAAQMLINGEGRVLFNRNYAIIGFNALSDSEQVLFKHLANAKVAEFFWDYDSYYVDNQSQEAGLFLRDNLRLFPNNDFEPTHREFEGKKNISVVAAPSESIQCKYVHNFLTELFEMGIVPDKQTAVVLTDENLLLPVLYSMPKTISKVNITMGYPLRQTPAYSFVERLLELQSRKREVKGARKFYHRSVSGLLTHPYVAELSGIHATQILNEIRDKQPISVDHKLLTASDDRLLTAIFDWIEGVENSCPYLINVLTIVGKYAVNEGNTAMQRSILATIIENIYKVENSLRECSVVITPDILLSLLRKVLQATRIPFEGEPIEGVQVMGILETRNLDFENVIVLSMNDETFPGNMSNALSFIPYNLRVAYGLPTPQHHEGVYAYYFYRLLQRAKNVNLVYCAKSDDKHTGEPSRYIYQLDYESPHKIQFKNIQLNVNTPDSSSIRIEKNEEIMAKLREFTATDQTRILTPSTFYNYIECPLKFYFHSIVGLREEEEISDSIDSALFGTILHKAVENIYRELEGYPQATKKLAKIVNTPEVDRAVDRAIETEYIKDGAPNMDDSCGGQLSLIKEIVVKYINKNILPYDITHDEFEVSKIEAWTLASLEIEDVGNVRLGGKVDRIDRLSDGSLRIVDYKTGSCDNSFQGIDGLFSENPKQRNRSAFQVMLYSMVLSREKSTDVVPTLYAVLNMNRDDFSVLLTEKQGRDSRTVVSFNSYKADFEERMASSIRELFDSERPFEQCVDESVCVYCDFKSICNR